MLYKIYVRYSIYLKKGPTNIRSGSLNNNDETRKNIQFFKFEEVFCKRNDFHTFKLNNAFDQTIELNKQTDRQMPNNNLNLDVVSCCHFVKFNTSSQESEFSSVLFPSPTKTIQKVLFYGS